MTTTSISLFVDTSSRRLNVYTVVVSEIPERGLILRFGAQVGQLSELVSVRRDFENKDLPILVSKKCFTAKESCGFVEIVTKSYEAASFRTEKVIGIQGMPWQKNSKSLKACEPFDVLVLKPGTSVHQILTHHHDFTGPGHWESNTDAATAARKAVELRAEFKWNSAFIVEGQSDYAMAWEFVNDEDPSFKFSGKYSPEWTQEFRRFDRFSDEELLSSAIWRKARKSIQEAEDGGEKISIEKIKGMVFIYENLVFLDSNRYSWKDKVLPPYFHQINGFFNENLSKILADLLAKAVEEEGWRFKVIPSTKMIQAKKGDVVVEHSYSDFSSVEEEQRLFELESLHIKILEEDKDDIDIPTTQQGASLRLDNDDVITEEELGD